MPVQSITSGIMIVSDNESLAIVLLNSENFEEVYGLLEQLETVCLSSLLGVAVGPRWAAKTKETLGGGTRILLDIRQVCKFIKN